jgi:hypothetical protein
MATKFSTASLNIRGSSLRNLLISPFRRLEFYRNSYTLVKSVKTHRETTSTEYQQAYYYLFISFMHKNLSYLALDRHATESLNDKDNWPQIKQTRQKTRLSCYEWPQGLTEWAGLWLTKIILGINAPIKRLYCFQSVSKNGSGDKCTSLHKWEYNLRHLVDQPHLL